MQTVAEKKTPDNRSLPGVGLSLVVTRAIRQVRGDTLLLVLLAGADPAEHVLLRILPEECTQGLLADAEIFADVRRPNGSVHGFGSIFP